MELNTPEERIAAAIWPPDNPDFRDVVNTISPYVDLILEEKALQTVRDLMTKEADIAARKLLLLDLVRQYQKSVDEKRLRVQFLEASKKEAEKKNVRPIR